MMGDAPATEMVKCRVCGKDSEATPCQKCQTLYSSTSFDLSTWQGRCEARAYKKKVEALSAPPKLDRQEPPAERKPAPVWVVKISLPVIAAVMVLHCLYFDHWGQTFAAVLSFVSGFLTREVFEFLLLTAEGLFVVAVFAFMHYITTCAPNRFYWGYYGLAVLLQFWCFMNSALLPDDLRAAFAGGFHPLTLLPTAAFLGVLSGLIFKIYEDPMDNPALASACSSVVAFGFGYAIHPVVVSFQCDKTDNLSFGVWLCFGFMVVLPIVAQSALLLDRLTGRPDCSPCDNASGQ